MTSAWPGVEIRPLRMGEIPVLIALAGEIWRAHYPGIITSAQIEYMLAQRYNDAVLRAELAQQDLWWDVLQVNNDMTGFASYFCTSVPGELKLDKLYVHPRAQRRGYGGLLLDHVCDAARAAGLTRLVLAVNKQNSNAIAAYCKYGFEQVDAVKKDIGGGFVMDDYVMTKKIGS